MLKGIQLHLEKKNKTCKIDTELLLFFYRTKHAMQGFDYAQHNDIISVKITSPTCEDLGIPRENEDVIMPARLIKNPSLHIDGLRYEAFVKNSPPSDPFSPLCMIPLPSPFTLDHLEPTFIRKRNERERERVRCVNDGYSRLKEHLPLENKQKRISKVEVLRRAIEYIRYLNAVLEKDDENKTEYSALGHNTDELTDSDESAENLTGNEIPNDTLVTCCNQTSPETELESSYFPFESLSDSDEVYGNGSDLGYESFSSGCEMEDENLAIRDLDFSCENQRGLKRPLECASAVNCASSKQQCSLGP